MLNRVIRTYSPKAVVLQIIAVSVLLGIVHYFLFSAPNPDALASFIYSIKFVAVLLGGYSLVQGWGRRFEFNLRRQELASANGDPKKIKKVQSQLDNIKKDKETGEMFMIVAFFITIVLSLFGKA